MLFSSFAIVLDAAIFFTHSQVIRFASLESYPASPTEKARKSESRECPFDAIESPQFWVLLAPGARSTHGETTFSL